MFVSISFFFNFYCFLKHPLSRGIYFFESAPLFTSFRLYRRRLLCFSSNQASNLWAFAHLYSFFWLRAGLSENLLFQVRCAGRIFLPRTWVFNMIFFLLADTFFSGPTMNIEKNLLKIHPIEYLQNIETNYFLDIEKNIYFE